MTLSCSRPRPSLSVASVAGTVLPRVHAATKNGIQRTAMRAAQLRRELFRSLSACAEDLPRFQACGDRCGGAAEFSR